MGPGTNPSTFSHTKALCLQTLPSLRACASGTLYGFFLIFGVPTYHLPVIYEKQSSIVLMSSCFVSRKWLMTKSWLWKKVVSSQVVVAITVWVSTDPMNSSLGTLPYSLSAQKESSEKMPCWNFSHEGMKVSKINWNYALELLVHLPVPHARSYARIFALVNFTSIWPYHL